MYAIIETGGKQYHVSKDEIIFVEKLDVAEGKTVTFDKVLMLDDKIGTPYVTGAKVTGKVIAQGKAKKIIVFKYKSKKNEHHKQGHRQPFTKVQITKIEAAKVED